MSLPAKLFTKEQILLVQRRLIDRFGGSHGVLSDDMLESSMGAIMTAMGYQELTPCAVAAKYCHKFIKNHCFVDGNKRIGPALGMAYLRLSGWCINPSNQDVIDMALAVATGEMSEEELVTWFELNAALQDKAT